jgi:hypothetical protein
MPTKDQMQSGGVLTKAGGGAGGGGKMPWLDLSGGGSSILGNVAGGLLGAFGMGKSNAAITGAIDDMSGMPGMEGPTPLSGNFGSVDASGNFTMDQGMQNMQNQLLSSGQNMLGGGLYNDPRLQAALQQNNIAGAAQQADQGFQQQLGSTAFGGLGGLNTQAQDLASMFGQQAAGGMTDQTGFMNQLFQQGMQNQMGAGNQQGLMAQQLEMMRAAAQPQQDRMFNKMQDRLFATGQLGSTGGGQQMEGLFNSFGQQDLAMQDAAFGRGQQQQDFMANLGASQFGQGLQGLQQNLGQYNQNARNFTELGGLAGGFEGQQFGQNAQAMGQNQSAGMNRLNAALGLFGAGTDTFNSQFGLGIDAGQGGLGYGAFGLDAAMSPQQLQAALLQGSGEHAQARASLAQPAAESAGGGMMGLATTAMSLFSDVRLKENLQYVGDVQGHAWYTWDWTDDAKSIVGYQPSTGVIAQQILETLPEAVSEHDGYLTVDYGVLLNG